MNDSASVDLPSDDGLEQREIRARLLQRLVIAVCLIILAGLAIAFLNRLEGEREEESVGPRINPVQADVSTVLPQNIESNASQSADAAGAALPENKVESALPTGEQSVAQAEPVTATSLPAVPAVSKSPVPMSASEPDGGAVEAVKNPAPKELVAGPEKKTAPTNDVRASQMAEGLKKPGQELTRSPQPAAVGPTVGGAPIVFKPVNRPATDASNPERAIAALAAGVLPAGSRGYSVQAGVFQSAENAGKLIARLEAAGIPTRVETRVQIGPFKSKQEADLILQRMRALGVTGIVQAP